MIHGRTAVLTIHNAEEKRYKCQVRSKVAGQDTRASQRGADKRKLLAGPVLADEAKREACGKTYQFRVCKFSQKQAH